MESKDYKKQALSALEQAEKAIGALAADAASAGDYQAVLWLAQLAKESADLAARGSPDASSDVRANPVLTRQTSSQGVCEPPSRAREVKQVKKHGRRKQYPKFLKHGDSLVKIGWSKKGGNEYRHRAPFQFVLAVARFIADLARDGQVFTGEELLSVGVRDNETDGEVPGYQVYLALAWLTQAGLVERHGRRGYSVGQPQSLSDRVRDLWSGLQEAGREG